MLFVMADDKVNKCICRRASAPLIESELRVNVPFCMGYHLDGTHQLINIPCLFLLQQNNNRNWI